MHKNLKTIIGFVIAGAAVLSTYAIYRQFFDEASDVNGRSELVLMDETSLWHSPFNSGISYGHFEPTRVRRRGAEYFDRMDTTDGTFPASGKRYGEIRLFQDGGGLLYMPRMAAFDSQDMLRIFLRRESAAGDWTISFYKTADEVATLSRDSTAVTVRQAGDWEEVTVRLADLSYEAAKPLDPQKNGDIRDPDFLLSQYVQPDGTIFGIGLSLSGGKVGDSLFLDRMSLLKKTDSVPNVLKGRITPPLPESTLFVRSDAGDNRYPVGPDGAFEVPVPAGAGILEVVAETQDRVISPNSGRFLENGSFLPELHFDTENPVIQKGVGEGGVNASLLVFEEKYGPRFEPMQDFLIQATNEGSIVASADLTTNRLGYVDRDHSVANQDGSYRVMIHGDSHHMGVHLAQADQWWNEAGAVANMKVPRPVEFISASFNYACWTSSWPAFQDLGNDVVPDLVLLPMIDPGILNLVSEEYMMDWLNAAKDHRPSYQFELRADGTVEHKPNDPDWQLYREPVSETDHLRIRKQYVSYPYIIEKPAEIPDWVKQSVALSVASLREFSKLAKQRGTRVAILYISDFGSSKTAKFEQDGVDYDPAKFKDLMRTIAEDSGVEFIDIADEIHMRMAGRDTSRIYFRDNGHFTPYGHYRYGQALGDLIAGWAK